MAPPSDVSFSSHGVLVGDGRLNYRAEDTAYAVSNDWSQTERSIAGAVARWAICAPNGSHIVPAVAIAFGWQHLFEEKMVAVWVLDFLFAYGLGVLFQYFMIAPMQDLSFRDGFSVAVKADTISITAWQIGMYGFVAFAKFYLFRHLPGTALPVNSFAFWFIMQIAMVCGS